MKSAQVAFGRAVRRLREKQGYSQEKFAHRAGIDRAYMSEVERGLTNVSLELIERIAKALDIRMGQLLTEADKEI
jgi:transcriptional regulator with XRE-family HTH domain